MSAPHPEASRRGWKCYFCRYENAWDATKCVVCGHGVTDALTQSPEGTVPTYHTDRSTFKLIPRSKIFGLPREDAILTLGAIAVIALFGVWLYFVKLPEMQKVADQAAVAVDAAP